MAAGLIAGGIIELGRELLGRVFPDPQQRAQAELELLKAAQEGRLAELQTQLSAILAEAQSADPLTSRARPTFLYVMYLMILAAVPVGIAHALNPAGAEVFTAGVQAWLGAIPQELWILFGTGYLGYTHYRSADKRAGVAK